MELCCCKRRDSLQKIAVKVFCKQLVTSLKYWSYVPISPDCVSLLYKQCKKHYPFLNFASLFSGRYGFRLRDLNMKFNYEDGMNNTAYSFYYELHTFLSPNIFSIEIDLDTFFENINFPSIYKFPGELVRCSKLRKLHLKWIAHNNTYQFFFFHEIGNVLNELQLSSVSFEISTNTLLDQSIYEEPNFSCYLKCNELFCKSLEQCSPKLSELIIINHGLHHTNIFNSILHIENLTTLNLHGCLNYVKESFPSDTFVILLQKLPFLKDLDISIDYFLRGELETANIDNVTSAINTLLKHIRLHKTSLEYLNFTGFNNVSKTILRAMQNVNTGIQYIVTGCVNANLPNIFPVHPRVKIIDLSSETNMFKALRFMLHCKYYIKMCIKLIHDDLIWNQGHLSDDDVDTLNIILKKYLDDQEIVLYILMVIYLVLKTRRGRILVNGSTGKTISLVIKALGYHSKHPSIVKGCIGILADDRLIEHADFNKLRLALLLGEVSQINNNKESRYIKFNVLIVMSMVVNRLDREDVLSLVGSGLVEDCVMDLFGYINEKSQIFTSFKEGDLLRATISVLWNMSDEAEQVCSEILDNDAIEAFIKIHRVYQDDFIVIGHILGLFSNIAEAKSCHSDLLVHDFIKTTIDDAKRLELECSFFACAIICNIADYWYFHQKKIDISFNGCMHDVKKIVDGWTYDCDQMVVSYRSFFPMEKLLKLNHIPTVQYWVIWTIRHVTKMDTMKYSVYIRDTSIYNICKDLMKTHSWRNVRKGARDIVSFVDT